MYSRISAVIEDKKQTNLLYINNNLYNVIFVSV